MLGIQCQFNATTKQIVHMINIKPNKGEYFRVAVARCFNFVAIADCYNKAMFAIDLYIISLKFGGYETHLDNADSW